MHPGEIDAAIRDSTPSGLEVSVDDCSQSPARSIPETVVAALIAATGEALRNVREHSRVGRAAVTIRLDRRGARITVSDHGVGSRVSPGGFGVRSSIYDRMAEVDGYADVRSTAGSGTTVEVGWPARNRGKGASLSEIHSLTRSSIHRDRVAEPAGAALLASYIWLVPSNLVETDHQVISSAIAICLVGITIATLRTVPHRPPTWPTLTLLSCTTGALAWSQVTLAGPGALQDFRSWGLGLASLPCVLLALYTPTRALPVLIAPTVVSWAVVVAIEPETRAITALGSLAVINLIVLAHLMGVVLRIGLRRHDEKSRELAEAQERVRCQERSARSRDDHLRHARTTIVPLLEQVVDGGLAPGSPAVRARAHLLSQEARDDLYLTEFFDPPLRLLVREARSRGGTVDIRPGFAPGAHHDVAGRSLSTILPRLPRGGRVTLSPASGPCEPIRLVVSPPLSRATAAALETLTGATARIFNDPVSTVVLLTQSRSSTGS